MVEAGCMWGGEPLSLKVMALTLPAPDGLCTCLARPPPQHGGQGGAAAVPDEPAGAKRAPVLLCAQECEAGAGVRCCTVLNDVENNPIVTI